MGLQRLFSFAPEVESFTPPDLNPPGMSRDSSGPSTVCSLGPDTPTEERTPLPYQLQLDLGDVGKYNLIGEVIPTPVIEPGDLSFEMRLDSLHFEALSFDIDGF